MEMQGRKKRLGASRRFMDEVKEEMEMVGVTAQRKGGGGGR